MNVARSIYDTKPCCQELTQGSIINGCIAEGYDNCEINGCIITPRCDIAHSGKVSYVHYVPVIDFEDWLLRDFKAVLFSKWQDKQQQYMYTIMKRIDANMILDTHLSVHDKLKIAKQFLDKEKFLEFQKILIALTNMTIDDFDMSCCSKDTIRQQIKNVLVGENHTYYALERWDNPEKYVVLKLRELHKIEYDIALQFSSGIEPNSFNIDVRNELVQLNENQLYRIKTTIKSPYIEHIMQAFVYNFARIGVEDKDPFLINNMVNSYSAIFK